MCFYGLLCLTICLAATADEPAGVPIKQDKDKLQGAWVIVGTGLGGIPTPAQGVPMITIIGDKISSYRLQKKGNEILKEKEQEWVTFTIDPTKWPKTIDVKFSSGPNKGKTAKGIYALARRKMLLCLGKAGRERPTEKDLDSHPECYILERAATSAGLELVLGEPAARQIYQWQAEFESRLEDIMLPASSSAQPLDGKEKSRLVLSVDQEGGLIVFGKERSLTDPKDIAAHWKKQFAKLERLGEKGKVETPVVVRADRRAEYGKIHNHLRLCWDQGFRKFELRALGVAEARGENSEKVSILEAFERGDLRPGSLEARLTLNLASSNSELTLLIQTFPQGDISHIVLTKKKQRTAVDLDELETQLRSLRKGISNKSEVQIEAPGRIEYRHIIRVLDAVRKCGCQNPSLALVSKD
jgi:uncharacterized protein (TIGR03067 family)